MEDKEFTEEKEVAVKEYMDKVWNCHTEYKQCLDSFYDQKIGSLN